MVEQPTMATGPNPATQAFKASLHEVHRRISYRKFPKPPTDTACRQQSPMRVPASKDQRADKKRRGVGDPSLIPEARPAGREVMIRQPFTW